ncbi:hypothetical protein [Sphingomonas sp.]|uniref:hypothetical protein n=1 Tax=Sphingomonas sp. TaxID=28214 RepID=UPI002DD61884|nr:hypothetical protein [Sphingomonas sp.]
MTGFDFVFALFSLILGLAVAEVLGGFAMVMKLHARARAGKAKDVRVGWLVPLLATYVTLNQLSFWMTGYAARDSLPFSYITLLAVLVIVGAYYLFSVLVFPDEPEDWPDFDVWYDQNNRFILIGLTVINLLVQVATAQVRPAATPEQTAAFEALGAGMWILVFGVWLQIVLLIVLIFVKRRWLNAVLLALLSLMTVAAAGYVAYAGLVF